MAYEYNDLIIFPFKRFNKINNVANREFKQRYLLITILTGYF